MTAFSELVGVNATSDAHSIVVTDAINLPVALDLTESAVVEKVAQESSEPEVIEVESVEIVAQPSLLQSMIADALKQAIESAETPFESVEQTLTVEMDETMDITFEVNESIEHIVPTVINAIEFEESKALNVAPVEVDESEELIIVECVEDMIVITVDESKDDVAAGVEDESSSDSDSSYVSAYEPSDSELALTSNTSLLPEEDAQTHLTTKNETALPLVEKCELEIQEDAILIQIGVIHAIVDSRVIVEATASGDYKVLDCGSVLCLENRTVIGVISDTFGKVSKPLYEIRFNTPKESLNPAYILQTPVYTPTNHANYVFTQVIREKKGTDASNFFDESCGEEECEFSDDEMEGEAKRKRKAEKDKTKDVKRREDGRDPRDGSLPERRGSVQSQQRDQRPDPRSDRDQRGRRDSVSSNQSNRYNDNNQRQFIQQSQSNYNQQQQNPQHHLQSTHVNPNFQPFQPSHDVSYAPQNGNGRRQFMTPNQYNQRHLNGPPQQQQFYPYNQGQGQFNQGQYGQMQQMDPNVMRMLYQQQYEQMQMMYGGQQQQQQDQPRLYEQARDRDDYEDGEI